MSEKPSIWEMARVYTGYSILVFLLAYVAFMFIILLVLGQFDIEPTIWEAP